MILEPSNVLLLLEEAVIQIDAFLPDLAYLSQQGVVLLGVLLQEILLPGPYSVIELLKLLIQIQSLLLLILKWPIQILLWEDDAWDFIFNISDFIS